MKKEMTALSKKLEDESTRANTLTEELRLAREENKNLREEIKRKDDSY